MVIKYLSFLIGLIWSYSLIKAHSIFSNKTALLFKIFISKISWLTFLIAIYYGFKNFSVFSVIIGIVIAVGTINLLFFSLSIKLKEKFGEKKVFLFKSFFEYFLIFLIIYYILT